VARGLGRVGTGVLDEIALRLAIVLEVSLVPAAALQAELRRRDEPLQLRLAALRALAQRPFGHFLQRFEMVPASTATILVDRHTARLCSSSGFFLDALHESERVTLGDDADDVAGAEIAAQDTLRERILQLLLNRALQRPRPVDGVEAGLREPIARGGIERKLDLAVGEPPLQILELDIDDLAAVLLLERVEHDDVVNAVDELGAEVLADDFHDFGLHARVVRLAS